MAKKRKKKVKKVKKGISARKIKNPKVKKAARDKKAKVKAKARGKAAGATRSSKFVYLSLGSNVGDREEYIEQAIFLLGKTKGIEVFKRSSDCESQAEGGGSQHPYLNAAVEIKTKLSPHKLLDVIQEIEEALGREREVEWGPRPIDIDVLFYQDQIISDDRLQIPHPLVHERLFVLKPLSEIAPHLVHPVLEKDIETLYDERKADLGDKYDDELPGFKEIKSGYADDYERW